MKTLATLLHQLRQAKNLTFKDLSAVTGIDQSLLARFESGKRKPTEAQLTTLSTALNVSYENLHREWLADKVYDLVADYPEALQALQVAESRLAYLRSGQIYEEVPISGTQEAQLQRLDELLARWNTNRPLNEGHLTRMREFFNLEYTYESNRIEGNTLSLQETALVVKEGLTISGKSMSEHLEAVNHSEAIAFLIDLARRKEALNQRNLLQLHGLILRAIDRENAGIYRKVNVRIVGSVHVPPEPWQVPKLMEEYFLRFEGLKKKVHPVLLAAEMHERLVTIHPFIDGNGRTSRLVMNLILLNAGFPIANLKGDRESRLNYYRALEAVQKDNEPQHFIQLVMDAVEDALLRHLEWVE